jgi:hypothetical protein
MLDPSDFFALMKPRVMLLAVFTRYRFISDIRTQGSNFKCEIAHQSGNNNFIPVERSLGKSAVRTAPIIKHGTVATMDTAAIGKPADGGGDSSFTCDARSPDPLELTSPPRATRTPELKSELKSELMLFRLEACPPRATRTNPPTELPLIRAQRFRLVAPARPCPRERM